MKISKAYLSILIVLITWNSASMGQSVDGFKKIESSSPIKDKIKASTSAVTSIQSDFIQEKHLSMMEEVLLSEGRFLFKRENQVLWQYTKPIDYAILLKENTFSIINEGELSTYDIEGNKMFREINNMILTAIQGNFIDNDDFRLGLFQNDKQILARLEPVDLQVASMLNFIEIFINPSSFDIEAVKFIESGGDYTRILFKNRLLNADIPDSAFEPMN